ncbi:unnamed protein product [Phytomonas sp. Hart1]|nr:unnamed protein product [Phytomonas sp. Hart1]|eukprot:CCW66146.1 unnamed protein product [Phytomonas sp. isolate Hart1]
MSITLERACQQSHSHHTQGISGMQSTLVSKSMSLHSRPVNTTPYFELSNHSACERTKSKINSFNLSPPVETRLELGTQENDEYESHDDDMKMGSVRLSRHIPQREGMDMSLSAFNLICNISNSTYTGPTASEMSHPHGSSVPIFLDTATRQAFSVSSTHTPVVSSTLTSFSADSHISDDDHYAASIYNDILAENLALHGDSKSGVAPTGKNIDTEENTGLGLLHTTSGRRGIGGDVFRFGVNAFHHRTGSSCTSKGDHNRISSAASPCRLELSSPSSFSTRRNLAIRHSLHTSSSSGRQQRVLFTNPERILDAPGFTETAAQLIDWGSNNKLIIGLKDSLYSWDAESRTAAKVLQLQGEMCIGNVHWLHRCTCIALSTGGGTTAIYDCCSGNFVRALRLPAGMEVTCLDVNGPVLAVASNGPTGCTQVFDLRAKNALIASYEGHSGPVKTMQYCTADPFYLATGGKEGDVCIWDSRRTNQLRYAFDEVHRGPVSAICWNPEKRNKLFTGGKDGVLRLIDTHATPRTQENHPIGGGYGYFSRPNISSYVTQAVQTRYPISGIIAQGEEVLTSHDKKGQLQLRKVSNIHLTGVFSALDCTAGLSCMVLAPDQECVCAAQSNETIKFWRVFNKGVNKQSSQEFEREAGSDSYLYEQLR